MVNAHLPKKPILYVHDSPYPIGESFVKPWLEFAYIIKSSWKEF